MRNLPQSFVLRSLAAACATAGACAVMAQERTNPFYVGVTQAVTHDSNVYRDDNNEVSETIYTTGLLLGMDQLIGRQRLFVDTQADISRHSKAKQLNSKGYTLRTGLDWETIESLSGTLHYSKRKSPADRGTSDIGTEVSDVITDQISVTGRYGMPSKVALDVGYEHRKLDYTNAVFDNRDLTQDVASLGLRWGVAGQFTFGIGGRATQGVTPKYSPVSPYEDELKRRDIDLSVVWIPSGFTTLTARLSHTDETHSLASNAAFSGLTGSISWAYRLTGKMNVNTSLIRDTGTETTFSGAAPTSTPGTPPTPGTTAPNAAVDNNRLSTSFNFDADYALTGKTSLSSTLRYRRGTLASQDREIVRGYGLGLRYAALRTLTFNCTVGREGRSVTGVQIYDATIATCSAELSLR